MWKYAYCVYLLVLMRFDESWSKEAQLPMKKKNYNQHDEG